MSDDWKGLGLSEARRPKTGASYGVQGQARIAYSEPAVYLFLKIAELFTVWASRGARPCRMGGGNLACEFCNGVGRDSKESRSKFRVRTSVAGVKLGILKCSEIAWEARCWRSVLRYVPIRYGGYR